MKNLLKLKYLNFDLLQYDGTIGRIQYLKNRVLLLLFFILIAKIGFYIFPILEDKEMRLMQVCIGIVYCIVIPRILAAGIFNHIRRIQDIHGFKINKVLWIIGLAFPGIGLGLSIYLHCAPGKKSI